jgi:hypothetical protein
MRVIASALLLRTVTKNYMRFSRIGNRNVGRGAFPRLRARARKPCARYTLHPPAFAVVGAAR